MRAKLDHVLVGVCEEQGGPLLPRPLPYWAAWPCPPGLLAGLTWDTPGLAGAVTVGRRIYNRTVPPTLGAAEFTRSMVGRPHANGQSKLGGVVVRA
jgi:hypothetical protein